jgi:hypothetical protein
MRVFQDCSLRELGDSVSRDPDRFEEIQREVSVRRLVDRYAHGCDTDDAALVASLFGDDGVLLVRDDVWAGDDLVRYYEARLTLPTLHFTTGLTITERADGLLDSTCGFIAIEMPGDEVRAVAGRYTDTVRVVDGEATFVSRRIDVTRRIGR